MELKPISKQELIRKFREIEALGWIENTTRKTNDGAAGNKLEDLLGIPENNLPIPNAAEWELKTQRDDTASLLTLFHMEPSPRALKIVPSLLLPKYGWQHQQAGTVYPDDEKSFRATLSATAYTRGFTVDVNESEQKVCIKFDATKVLDKDQDWLKKIKQQNLEIENLEIVPYWGFADLFGKARTKLLNCFFVLFESRTDERTKFFHYYKAYKLQNLNMEKFLQAIKDGFIFIDFDARTGHNHGTKFRINPQIIPSLYEKSEIVMNEQKLNNNG